MASDAVTQSIIFILALVALSIPLGLYMVKVFSGEKTFLDRLLRPIERGIYRVAHVNEDLEMNWKQYALALLLFNLV